MSSETSGFVQAAGISDLCLHSDLSDRLSALLFVGDQIGLVYPEIISLCVRVAVVTM